MTSRAMRFPVFAGPKRRNHEIHSAIRQRGEAGCQAEAIERAAELGIQDPELHIRAATIQHALGDDEAVRAEVEAATQINPLGVPYLSDQDTRVLDELLVGQ